MLCFTFAVHFFTAEDEIICIYRLCGFDIEWRGSGLDEIGFEKNTNRDLIKIDPSFFRPTEVDTLIGDSRKAKEILNWRAKTTFKELVHLMMESDLKQVGLDPINYIKPVEC